jgi:SAM-dependent methyltransferase
VGIDRDPRTIAEASDRVPGASFHVLDQRELPSLDDTFDAAMILWQSFGYFDGVTNDRVLGDIAELLRPGGRPLLDVYHPTFVRQNVGDQVSTRAADCRSIRNAVEGGRLISTITYVDGSHEAMDFELFMPEDLIARAGRHGLELLHACSWWDPEQPPSEDAHRYQLVLQRT